MSNTDRLPSVLLIAVLSFLVAPAFGAITDPPAASGVTAPQPSAAPPNAAPRAGYSIFRDTLVDLAWPEVKKAAEAGALVLVPVGVIEEHGPHLSLGPDTYLAYAKCRQLKAELAARHVEAVIAPPVYWGVMQSKETGAFPGSFTVRPETMKALLLDIFADLKTWGFQRVYCVNHHGDRVHRRTLREAMAEAKATLGLAFYNDQEAADAEGEPSVAQYLPAKLFEPDFHSGIAETAAMRAYFPEEVNVGLAKTLQPESTFQPLGYVGDPANHEKVNMRAIDRVEIEYQAKCIASWLRQPNQS
ncbi:MAG TPA: creatininase family protein [Opitutaceae bacterium]|nr:creatininase family protein [Opitutaceae bacterium]